MKKIILLATMVALTLPMWANGNSDVFDNVQSGMNIEQVNALLGEPMEKMEGNNIVEVIYTNVENPNKPFYVLFVNNLAVGKGTTNKRYTLHVPAKIVPLQQSYTANNTNNIVTDSTHNTNNLITVTISYHFDLKDKIFICNQSPYPVLRAVVVNGSNYNHVLGACNLLNPQDCVEIADFPYNGLSDLRGQNIGIKVKGLKNNSTNDFTNYSDDNTQSEQVTYDFNISLAEQQHDLYIYIIGGEEIGNDPLDF